MSSVGFWFLPASILIIVLLATSAKRANFSWESPSFFLSFFIFVDKLLLDILYYNITIKMCDGLLLYHYGIAIIIKSQIYGAVKKGILQNLRQRIF